MPVLSSTSHFSHLTSHLIAYQLTSSPHLPVGDQVRAVAGGEGNRQSPGQGFAGEGAEIARAIAADLVPAAGIESAQAQFRLRVGALCMTKNQDQPLVQVGPMV